ncbi:MAG: hypothetical protein IPI30_01315 [Saprospiraceae bacterium]|nr:hypothetical protein [Candidatus Vicinibacter affinis]
MINSKLRKTNCYHLVLFFFFILCSCDIQQSTVFNDQFGGHFRQRMLLNSLRQEFFESGCNSDPEKFQKAFDSIQVELVKMEFEIGSSPMLPNSIKNVHFLLEKDFYYTVEFEFLDLKTLNNALEIIRLIKRSKLEKYFPEEENEFDFSRQTFELDKHHNFIIKYKDNIFRDTTSNGKVSLMNDTSNLIVTDHFDEELLYDEFIPNTLLNSGKIEMSNKAREISEGEDFFNAMSIQIFQEWKFPREIRKIKINIENKNLLQFNGVNLWMKVDDQMLESIEDIKEIKAIISFKK